MPKNAEKYFSCDKCDFVCSKKSNYTKHFLTLKHSGMTPRTTFAATAAADATADADVSTTVSTTVTNTVTAYICPCGKSYQHRQSLFTHRKKCTGISAISNDDMRHLLKENAELKTLILDVCKSINQTTQITCCTNVVNNKTFNLNLFLNETCKDAMNIMEFVDSLRLQISDLETLGKIGYVEGISNIIVKHLNSLDETKRPIHCTDSKRETMYVKDEDKWEKENETKQKIRKAIKHVAHKNSKLLNDFKTIHPNCDKSDSVYSDHFNRLIIEAMGGLGDNYTEKEDKIMRNIAKEVTIDKQREV